mmetsp:Transcript_55748/g.130068  ORF Transcript_55748/g.130068 Transcript_55748/m.130068 type:complete len:409 (+) Transcript_55748:66-1292(+)
MELWEFPDLTGNAGFSFLRCRVAVITCLHRLSCQICLPPPEVPDACRLLIALGLFGGAATALTATDRLGPGVTIYCVLGLARILSEWTMLLVASLALAASSWLLQLASWPLHLLGPVLLVALSELCWLRTMQKVLDNWFETFVAIMFIYLGVIMVFAFYPALLQFGPELMTSGALAVSSAAEGAPGAPSPHFGSEDLTSGFTATTSVLPLLAIVVGVPVLSVVILIYCWMCHHMSRMVLTVVLTFCMWILLYGVLVLLHVPFSRDLLGKGLLVSVCIVMYSAFTRLTSVDPDSCETRRRLVAVGFATSLLIDAGLGAQEGEVCVETLFFMLCACKLAYASVENAIDHGGTDFHLSFLLPLRLHRKQHHAGAATSDAALEHADPSDGLPSSSYEMMEPATAEAMLSPSR